MAKTIVYTIECTIVNTTEKTRPDYGVYCSEDKNCRL